VILYNDCLKIEKIEKIIIGTTNANNRFLYLVISKIIAFTDVHVTLQFSLQDNGSAKYFQGAMHTPNMGEKVAQVSEISLLRYAINAQREKESLDKACEKSQHKSLLIIHGRLNLVWRTFSPVRRRMFRGCDEGGAFIRR